VPATIDVDGATMIAHLEEAQIGATEGAELRERILAELPAEGARIAIDLSRVDFLDSSGLGSLVSLLKEVRPTGDVVLYGAKPTVTDILRLTHLDSVFHCAPGRDQALRHLAGASRSA
jgi:anti-sigma B factor antagonist